MFEIDGMYELSDYQHGNKRHAAKQWSIRRVLVLFILVLMALGLGYILSTLTNPDLLLWLVLFLLALAIAFLIYTFVLFPAQVKKIFYQQKELSLPFHMKLDEKGLLFQNELSSSLRPWNLFTKWDEDEKIMLLYLNDMMFVMIPKRMLTDETSAFIQAQLKSNNIPSK